MFLIFKIIRIWEWYLVVYHENVIKITKHIFLLQHQGRGYLSEKKAANFLPGKSGRTHFDPSLLWSACQKVKIINCFLLISYNKIFKKKHHGEEHPGGRHLGEVPGEVLQEGLLIQGEAGQATHVGPHVQDRVAGVLHEAVGLGEHRVAELEAQRHAHNTCTGDAHHTDTCHSHVHSYTRTCHSHVLPYTRTWESYITSQC